MTGPASPAVGRPRAGEEAAITRQWDRVRDALSRLVGAPIVLSDVASGRGFSAGRDPTRSSAGDDARVLRFEKPVARLSAPAADPARLAAAAELVGLLAEREAAVADLARHVAQLWREINFILAAERDLALPLDARAAARSLLGPVLATLGAERGSVYLSEEAGALVAVAAHGIPEAHLEPIAIDDEDSIAAWVYRHGSPLLVNDATRLPRSLHTNQFPLAPGSRNAFLSLPLLLPNADRTPIGVVNLAGKQGGHFTTDDVKVATAVTQMVAVAIHRSHQTSEALVAARLREELRLAADIHAGLLPANPPPFHGVTIATGMEAAGAVSGDYFDFVVGDRRLDLLVADVQGHGLGAALLVGTVRVVLRTALGEGLEPAAALERLNQAFLDTAYERGVFATAAVVRIRGSRLTYSSAGHPPPLVAERGRARALESGGPPAGVVPDARYAEGEDELERGGSIALYSDGLLGQGGQKALDRLTATLERAAEEEPDSIVHSMMNAVDDRNDDRTIIVARRD